MAWILEDWLVNTAVPEDQEEVAGVMLGVPDGKPLKLRDVVQFRHLLDDFIFVLAPHSKSLAHQVFRSCVDMFKWFGFPLNTKKLFDPDFRQIVFGIGLDTQKGCFYIPDSKALKALAGLNCFLKCSSVSLKELQSLIGLLAFLARALVASRTFLRRLIDLTCGVAHQHQRIGLDGVMDDLNWWITVLESRHMFAMKFQDSKILRPSEHSLSTDSCLFACGAVFEKQWFSFRFPEAMQKHSGDIALKELAALVLAVMTWSSALSGKRILVHCDNQAVVAVTKSGTCKNQVIMSLMRYFVLQCLKRDLSVVVSYIPSEENTGPDLLSRMKVKEFRRCFPVSQEYATPILEFWKELYESSLFEHYG